MLRISQCDREFFHINRQEAAVIYFYSGHLFGGFCLDL